MTKIEFIALTSSTSETIWGSIDLSTRVVTYGYLSNVHGTNLDYLTATYSTD